MQMLAEKRVALGKAPRGRFCEPFEDGFDLSMGLLDNIFAFDHRFFKTSGRGALLRMPHANCMHQRLGALMCFSCHMGRRLVTTAGSGSCLCTSCHQGGSQAAGSHCMQSACTHPASSYYLHGCSRCLTIRIRAPNTRHGTHDVCTNGIALPP